MRTSDKGLKLLKAFEGLRLQSYLDIGGVPTIGYGHTGSDVGLKMFISKDGAEYLLKQDLVRFEDAVTTLVVNHKITQNQFDALVCFVYNVGIGALKTSTLLKKVNAGDITAAGNEFLRWNKVKGKVVAGLTNRRSAERDLFLGNRELV